MIRSLDTEKTWIFDCHPSDIKHKEIMATSYVKYQISWYDSERMIAFLWWNLQLEGGKCEEIGKLRFFAGQKVMQNWSAPLSQSLWLFPRECCQSDKILANMLTTIKKHLWSAHGVILVPCALTIIFFIRYGNKVRFLTPVSPDFVCYAAQRIP